MVIVDELSFRFVEGEGFKNFCQVMQPRFSIPSRVTIAKDIYQLFLEERKKLRVEFSKGGQRICLTTDCWTSVQNINYLCLTVHYVDSEWTLQKRIINFCQISSHKGESVGKVIESCLHAWGIERVFTMTIDNASSNDSMITYLRRKIKGWKGVVLGGEFLHVRSCAHIVNLIVNEGLKDLHDSIAAVRNAVRYVRSSPARLLKFKSCVEREKIEFKGLVCLDVPTRWNSTYMMLDAAIKFQKAFERYEDEDDKFVSYFWEDEGGKQKIGPPLDDDWKNVKVFVKFLKTFYDITLKFSATLNVTSNSYFHELCEMQNQLSELSKQDDSMLSSMAVSMKKKYDKYWGSVENINCLLFVAVVLDPRYKMDYLTYCCSIVYDSSTSETLAKNVKDTMYRLHEVYSGDKGESVANASSGEAATTSTTEAKTTPKEKGRLWSKFVRKMKEKNVNEYKNDVDRYLTDPMEDPTRSNFDVLEWWKNNATN
ncbi:zinc finger BED domain-containing protein RICESLEEPER 2-like [Morus notabilis]|uniref:zinc finger BED domain-containing protein RICESLEEPER 2-like n=1 Tax=Morus notabilis TaxID=981085 RepID=UPI000CED7EEC|nr:zinc finger BED domain-containing protein RICESLEEPER 2-like [Morus notabilis]